MLHYTECDTMGSEDYDHMTRKQAVGVRSSELCTVEPRFNEPLFNEVLDITNDIISMSRPKLQ